jgi:hypothetical protein
VSATSACCALVDKELRNSIQSVVGYHNACNGDGSSCTRNREAREGPYGGTHPARRTAGGSGGGGQSSGSTKRTLAGTGMIPACMGSQCPLLRTHHLLTKFDASCLWLVGF